MKEGRKRVQGRWRGIEDAGGEGSGIGCTGREEYGAEWVGSDTEEAGRREEAVRVRDQSGQEGIERVQKEQGGEREARCHSG